MYQKCTIHSTISADDWLQHLNNQIVCTNLSVKLSSCKCITFQRVREDCHSASGPDHLLLLFLKYKYFINILYWPLPKPMICLALIICYHYHSRINIIILNLLVKLFANLCSHLFLLPIIRCTLQKL